ncbi:histamine H2 receptor [Odontesthes bonariensis]|uniref:histamine H2 receptor n=1 Tax=Odontesthes bonariensis TaxID=219752 RepID=UPI003F58DE3E
MAEYMLYFLGWRIFVSSVGLLGNVLLILSIIQTMSSRVKSFELFLMGLAAANLEEIVIINIYEVIILQTSSAAIGTWSCQLLQFLTLFGETASILFTVIISIFRYQKLRDAERRVNLPIYLDNIRSAWKLSGVCVMISTLLCIPIFAIHPQGSAGNLTRNGSSCPPDFFQCDENHCPTFNRVYKYLFSLLCHLLPLVIVTVASCLIIAVLLSQRKVVAPAVSVSQSGQLSKKSTDHRLNRSTIAVVAAMGLFQIDWTLYLIFQWTFSTIDLLLLAQVEFFISTSYTSLCPYVYGIGQNLFSLKKFKRKVFKTLV